MEVVEEEVAAVEDNVEDKTDDTSKGSRGGTITRSQFELFVKYLRTNIKPTKTELKDAHLIDDSPVKYSKNGYGLTGRFVAWAKRMTLHEKDDRLFFKKTCKEILCREDFEEAVRDVNKTISGSHFSFVVTLKKLREKYSMGKRQFGMSEDFVREVLITCTSLECRCKKVKKLRRDDLKAKTLRATKSCSSLSDDVSYEKTPPRERFLTDLASSERKRKMTVKTANQGPATKPPVAYYALLDLASIRSKQLHTTTKSDNLGQTGSNMILFDDQEPNCLIGEPKVVPATNSIQGTGVFASSAILAQLSKCIPTVATSQKSGNKRPVYYKLYSNPTSIAGQSISSVSSSLCTSTPQNRFNENDLSSGQFSNTKGQTDVKVKSPTKVTHFPARSKSSLNPLEFLDSLTTLSMFADSPSGRSGIEAALNKFQKPNEEKLSCIETKTATNPFQPSFKLPSAAKLPYSELWYFHHDVHTETNRYKKLVNVISDMNLDLKQSFMGSKPAAERLRKKLVVAESLVSQCKEITGSRMKIASERKKAKKLESKKANHRNIDPGDTDVVDGV